MMTDELLQRWSDGSITADELRELTAKLAKPEHQSTLLDDWLLESSLPDRLPGAAVAGLQESAMNRRIERIAPVRAKQWAGWLSWRPLTAAAAGLVIGLFSASMVYGFISQAAAGRVVPLVVMNAGFETGEGPLKPGHSRLVAEWNGAGALAATPEGRRCARLAPSLPLKEKSRAGVLLQTLDLETMGAVHVPEGARLVISAEINASHEPAAGMRQFALRVLTFPQTAGEVLASIWPDQQEAAEANVVRTLEVDGDARSWQRLRTRLELPKGTRSVMIEISGPRTPPGTQVDSLPEFWVDAVQAHLELPREVLP